MATYKEIFTLFKGLAGGNQALHSFQFGPGDFFPVNPNDESYPMMFLEQEQYGTAINALDRYTVAFWILDRTFAEAADPQDDAARCLSKCQQIGRSVLARLQHEYPDAVPEPFEYTTAAVPQIGSDRVYGFRFEVALDFVYELDTCLTPYPVGEHNDDFSLDFS
jgi:hypothetical protein